MQAECDTLESLLKSLPATLPLNPSSSLLPPQIDAVFASAEGPWPAFNKAMHATFGNKSKGLKIMEQGESLLGTVPVIRWVLKELAARNESVLAELVKLWIDTLAEAAKTAGAGSSV